MQLNVTQQDIDTLAAKLDKTPDLSDKDRTLLLGVFGMAQGYIASNLARGAMSAKTRNLLAKPATGQLKVTAESPTKLPKLSEGFRDTFKPGLPGAVGGGIVENAVDVGVGAPCVSVGWSKDT